jgi:hypothetical protein
MFTTGLSMPSDNVPLLLEDKKPAHQGNRDAGQQRSTQAKPFTPTTEILSEDGIAVAWDLLEESSRALGIPATALKYNVRADTILKRKRLKKWKDIPDGRTLTKTVEASGAQLATTPGDFTGRIAGYRERVFKKVSDSIDKFKAKAPKSFKELDSASKIAERMMGIGDETTKIGVLVHLNEAIDQHGDDMQPIEATEVVDDAALLPSIPDSPNSATVQQGSSAPARDALSKSNEPAQPSPSQSREEPKRETSRTLNPNDNSKRQFVLPGIIER